MRRNYWVVVASMVVMTVLTGCSDTVVSPAAAPSGPTTMMQAPVGHPNLSLTGAAAQNTSANFTVSPWGGVYFVGNHAVVFPAHSICDPATSGYGSDVWDAPCSPSETGVAIHAEVRKQNGRTWVDFSPELRFVPSANPTRWVWIVMSTPQARGAQGDLSAYNILYAESIGGVMVNDASSDPTLRTYVNTFSGTSFRRIKHFSGYTASAGFTCDPNVEDCSGGETPSTPTP
ncbi:MAG TPA: hypothetical protein VFI52_06855 [Gemmatimonadaceae bacterium]|nr:hypothetical protein [Gemmatimonadaceae bacterium]